MYQPHIEAARTVLEEDHRKIAKGTECLNGQALDRIDLVDSFRLQMESMTRGGRSALGNKVVVMLGSQVSFESYRHPRGQTGLADLPTGALT